MQLCSFSSFKYIFARSYFDSAKEKDEWTRDIKLEFERRKEEAEPKPASVVTNLKKGMAILKPRIGIVCRCCGSETKACVTTGTVSTSDDASKTSSTKDPVQAEGSERQGLKDDEVPSVPDAKEILVPSVPNGKENIVPSVPDSKKIMVPSVPNGKENLVPWVPDVPSNSCSGDMKPQVKVDKLKTRPLQPRPIQPRPLQPARSDNSKADGAAAERSSLPPSAGVSLIVL